MLPCEKTQCVKFLTTKELIEEISNRKAFEGLVIHRQNSQFHLTHTLDKDTLIKALQKALEMLQ